MEGPISVGLWNIYVCNMEEDIVAPSKRLFCKCYVDNTYVLRRRREKKIKLMNSTTLQRNRNSSV